MLDVVDPSKVVFAPNVDAKATLLADDEAVVLPVDSNPQKINSTKIIKNQKNVKSLVQ